MCYNSVPKCFLSLINPPNLANVSLLTSPSIDFPLVDAYVGYLEVEQTIG